MAEYALGMFKSQEGSGSGRTAVSDAAPLPMSLYHGTEAGGNLAVTCYASAARTATPTAMADQTNLGHRGLHVVIDVTAVTADPSVVFTIQGKDSLSGKYYTLLASAALVTTGTVVLKVYPGITVAANLSVSDVLPRTWRVIAVHGDTDSITYSVGASLEV
jgi:hypothetical protein